MTDSFARFAGYTAMSLALIPEYGVSAMDVVSMLMAVGWAAAGMWNGWKWMRGL